MSSTADVPRYDVARALKAVRALLANPDDLPQVFTIIEALPGHAPERLAAKLMAHETGRALLAEQPDIVPLLSDRARLEAMPAGSLAHAYLAFLDSEGISASGLLAASAQGSRTGIGRFTWQRHRLRDTHDLWHTVTGYRGDVVGELALLAFTLAQNFQPGVALMIAAAFTRGLPRDQAWLVAEGYVRGKRAPLLAATRWEDWLHLPLTEVRARLSLSSPPTYRTVRTAELREMGKVG